MASSVRNDLEKLGYLHENIDVGNAVFDPEAETLVTYKEGLPEQLVEEIKKVLLEDFMEVSLEFGDEDTVDVYDVVITTGKESGR